MNKEVLSKIELKLGCRPVLLLLVVVALNELVVFVEGIFERVKSPNFCLEKGIESKKIFFGAEKI